LPARWRNPLSDELSEELYRRPLQESFRHHPKPIGRTNDVVSAFLAKLSQMNGQENDGLCPLQQQTGLIIEA